MTPTVSVVMTDRTDVEPDLSIINDKRTSNGLQTATLVSLSLIAEQAYDPAVYYLENTDGSEVRTCFVGNHLSMHLIWVSFQVFQISSQILVFKQCHTCFMIISTRCCSLTCATLRLYPFHTAACITRCRSLLQDLC
jgi:hypothetical protein